MSLPRLSLLVAGLGSVAAVCTGCGGGAAPPSSAGRITPVVRSALAAWSRFPVHASSRPLVLIEDDDVNAPALGFRDVADKLAYQNGAVTAPSVFPPGPASAGGYRLIGPVAAFGLLVEHKTQGPSSPSSLTVTTVTLGSGEFDTDRGSRRLPAWLFRFDGVQNPAEVLAVSPSEIFAAPTPRHATETSVGAATLGPDGRTLTVTFAGAPTGHGPCTASYTMSVGSSVTAVAVEVHAHPHASHVACLAEARADHLSAELAGPLGNRVVVDAPSLNAVPVTPAAS